MKMDRLIITSCIKIIKTYYKPATATYRALKADYGLYNRPTTHYGVFCI